MAPFVSMCASRSHCCRWYAIGLEMFRALLWISWHLLTSHPTSQAIGAVTGMEEVAKKMEAAQGKDIEGHMNNRFISSYHFVNMQYKYAICILQVVWKICTVSHDVLIAQEFQVPKAEQFAEKNLQAMPVPLTISYNLIQSHHVNRFDPGCTDAISGAGGARLGCKRPGVSSQPRAWCSPQRIAPRPMDFTSVFIKCSSWNDIAQWWTVYINLLYNVYYI